MSIYKQKTFPINTLQQRELTKAIYTPDKRKALVILNEAEKKYSNETKTIDGAYLCGHDYTEDEKTEILKNRYNSKVGTQSKFFKIQSRGFRYFGSSFDSYKAHIIVDVYIMDIVERIEKQNINEPTEQIYNLLDEIVKIHTGIFNDTFLDELFKDEYNGYIKDKLQEVIDQKTNIRYKDITEIITEVTKKPLLWNANKNTIGTLFGVLLQNGIITGTNTDISKGLSALFSNLSEDTLKDNLNLKINSNDNKTLYDTETETLLKDWIDYLKKQKTKKTTTKSTTKTK